MGQGTGTIGEDGGRKNGETGARGESAEKGTKRDPSRVPRRRIEDEGIHQWSCAVTTSCRVR